MAQVLKTFLILLFFWQSAACAYPKIKVLTTTYFAHQWSDTGRYRQVSKNGVRLGNFVALNFLPGGSIIMIPALLKTTKLIVADTLGGSGRGHFKGKPYWKVDILRNEAEWMDDIDKPVELLVVKYNKAGPVKNRQVRQNCEEFLKSNKIQETRNK